MRSRILRFSVRTIRFSRRKRKHAIGEITGVEGADGARNKRAPF
jgi:hypothetical protein